MKEKVITTLAFIGWAIIMALFIASGIVAICNGHIIPGILFIAIGIWVFFLVPLIIE